MNQLLEKLDFEIYKIDQEIGPEQPRFFRNSKKIKEWIELPEFKKFKNALILQLENKKHKFRNEIQNFVLKQSRADIPIEKIFSIITNSELDYGHVKTASGKKIKITNGNKLKLSKNRDPKIRRDSSINYAKGFLKHKGTLSNILYEHFKKTSTYAKLRKFNSSIESLLYPDRVEPRLLDTLYTSVQKNLDIFKPYSRAHSKFYKSKFGKRMTKYDTNVELVRAKGNWSVEEAQKSVADSMKVFGEEYHSKILEAFEERWIDYMPVNNKRSGAYSIGASYSIDKKFILMNFDGSLNSVSTLAHELGHSMHSYYSDKNQTLTNSQYPILLAEIASIFNELVLNDHLLKNATSDKVKFYIREKMIKSFLGTVVRQTEWSNYEYDLYNATDEGKPYSTYESLSKLYYENSKKYSLSNRDRKFESRDQYPAIYVPHFYYGFYVYKYAIGQLCGAIFFQKYKEDPAFLQKYINKFLSAGGKKPPLEILKDSGIDLYDPETYKLGFDVAKENVEEYIKLGNKIFN